jgi:hypothetical protein
MRVMRRLAWLLIGMALVSPARAEEFSLCNGTGEPLAGLFIDGHGMPHRSDIKDGECTGWDGLAPGRYAIHAMLGETPNAVLCVYNVDSAAASRVTLKADTPASCIK